MSAETTTTALIDEALKVIFAKSLHDDIVADHELMSLFKAEMNVKTEETTGGRYIEQGHFWQLPAGAGWRKDDEYIPEAVSAKFKNSRLFLRKMFVTLQMSGDTMRRVRTEEGAFLNYMEQAKPAVVEFANNQLDLAYLGTGSGIKATVSAKISDNGDGTYTIGVKHHSGVPGYTEAWLCFLEGENIVFSATYAFATLRNAGTGQSATVVGIDEDANHITIKCAAGLYSALAVDDKIAEGDGAGYSAVDADGDPRMLAGLLAGDDDGGIVEVYNNIDRMAKDSRLWRANVIDGSASPYEGSLNEDLLDFAFRRTLVRGSGKPSAVVMSHSASTMYWRSLKGDKRFVDPAGNFTGGKGKLRIIVGDSAYDLRVCRKLPPEVVFGLQADRWARLTLGQLTWEEETGSMWNRVVDSSGRKDEYYSVAHLYEQLYATAPRKNFRIDGLLPAENPTAAS
jgi:hypothetical protein